MIQWEKTKLKSDHWPPWVINSSCRAPCKKLCPYNVGQMFNFELNSIAFHAHAKDYTRAVIKGCNLQHLLQLSMLDSPLMLWVKLSVVDRIQPKLTGFYIGVESKAWMVIHNLMTAQRSDITLICENENFSFYSSQLATVSKLRSSKEDYRVDHLTF